jgi:hypothetical protein
MLAQRAVTTTAPSASLRTDARTAEASSAAQGLPPPAPAAKVAKVATVDDVR